MMPSTRKDSARGAPRAPAPRMKQSAAYQPRPRRKLRLAIPAALAVLLLAYGLGRWTADGPASAPAPPAAPAPIDPPAPLPQLFVAPAPPPPMARKPEPPPPAPAAQPPSSPTPEILTRVTEETKARIETLRPQMISRCWPSGGLRGGRASARLTFNVAFDAQGREVMRGVSEDRRAPAGEFARCVREMEGTMTVSAPGTNVTVSVPMTFP
jgi:hypothetical protein